MKKIINKILILALAISTVISCEDPDNAVYDVFDDTTRGAVLRTLDIISGDYNIFDASSLWAVKIEEQDLEDGNLLKEVNVYISFKDNKDDGVNNSKAEVLMRTIPKSEFTTSENGLPSTTISATLTEAAAAAGVTGVYNGGDRFTFRLEVVLTDGRSFSSDDASGSLQGSFFRSPYKYSAGILCIPDSPITGTYKVAMQDSYGDGWQGSKVICTIDGVDHEAFLLNQWAGNPPSSEGTAYIVVPDGAASVEWSFVAGSYPSEVTFQIYGPNSGNIIGDFGPSPAEGPLALNLCDE